MINNKLKKRSYSKSSVNEKKLRTSSSNVGCAYNTFNYVSASALTGYSNANTAGTR